MLPQQPDTIEGRSKFEVLDAEGRIYIWRGFLTPEECDHLIAKGTPRLRRSWVVDSESDKPGHRTEHVSDIRTSSSMFFKRREDPIVARIEKRIAQWTLIPESHAEGFNMVS
jgi:prolyl 4-hydroxylase